VKKHERVHKRRRKWHWILLFFVLYCRKVRTAGEKGLVLVRPSPNAINCTNTNGTGFFEERQLRPNLPTSIILCCVRRPVSEAPRKIYRVTKILLKGTDLCRRQRLFNVSTNCHADWQPTNELHRLPVGHSYFSTQSLN
jgi:hypothetical protein